jgi:arsenite methyltransferase
MPYLDRTQPFFVKAIWVLAIGIVVFISVITWADNVGTDFAKLERQLFEAFRNQHYSKAINIAEKMHQLNPEHIDTLYNIAILHIKLGNEDKAYEWFEKAAEAGGIRSFRKSYFERYIAMLEHKDRDEFQKPEKVMEAMALKPGERVAEIGAGSGYFTIRIAKTVGPTGLVWAIDIEQEMLDYIEKRAVEEKIKNIRLKLVPEDNPQLPNKGVDTIIIIHTYPYIRKRIDYVKKLRAALVPGGRIVIIDYVPKSWEERPWGPLPHQQVPRSTVDSEMTEAGFKPIKVHDFLPQQYFVEYGIKD